MSEYEDVNLENHIDSFFKDVDVSYIIEAVRELTYNEEFKKKFEKAFKANDRATVGELIIDGARALMMEPANEQAALVMFDKNIRPVL